jgi:transposase
MFRLAWAKSGLKGKNLTHTVKHNGGGIMVWGCFSQNGIGKLVFIDGIMDAAQYVSILSTNLTDSAKMMNLQDFILQQDNDPKHTAKISKNYFTENWINVLDWPPQSPDMNPIESLWGILKEKVAKRMPKNLKEEKEYLSIEWYNIPKDLTTKLAKSLKKELYVYIEQRESILIIKLLVFRYFFNFFFSNGQYFMLYKFEKIYNHHKLVFFGARPLYNSFFV